MDECAFEVEGIRVEISRTPAEPVEDLQYYSTIPKLAKVGDTVRGVPGLVVTVNGEGGWECAARLQDFIMDTASREILTQVVRKGLSELDPLSIDALKQLSAAKARITELEACLAWASAEYAKRIAELEAQAKALRADNTALAKAVDRLQAKLLKEIERG